MKHMLKKMAYKCSYHGTPHHKCELKMVVLCTFGFIGKKAVNFLYCPVVSTNDKAMVVHVQDEVLALRVERERKRR